MRHTLFISDVHLDESRPEVTARFLRFLEDEASQAEALYILGDFFDSWIGDDEGQPLHTNIATALRALADEGVLIYFMVGNHDFLIGRQFAEAAGMTLIKDPTIIDLYGRRALLMHGDSLCTLDVGHQRFRKIAHNQVLQWLFTCLPIGIRQLIKKKIMGHTSNKYKYGNGNKFMLIPDDEVRKQMHQHGATLLIHGHTHQPSTKAVSLSNGEEGQHMVLPPWSQDTGAAIKIEDST